MKLRSSKKTVILLALLFFTSFAGGVYLLFNREETVLSKPSRWGDSYDDFARRCSEEKRPSKIVCKAFIVKEVESLGDDTVCFDLLVYDGVGDLANMGFCDEPSSFEWDNPYGNYEKHVPVIIEMSTRKSLFGSTRPENTKLILMEDQEIFDILSTLPEDLGRGSYFQTLIYIKEHQEILDNGYYITSPMGSDTRDHLVLHDVKIQEISVQGGEVVLSIITRIYGEKLNLLMSTKGFLFFDTESEIEGGTLVDVEGVDFFDKVGSFIVVLNFNPEEIEIEGYLKSLSESEEGIVLREGFNLVQILAK